MWETIFRTIKEALAGAFSSRNDASKYRVKFKMKDGSGKWVGANGEVTAASVEENGASFDLKLNGQSISLEARSVAGSHAQVLVNGVLQEDARLGNPKIHFDVWRMKTLVDYPFRPIMVNDIEHRIEVLYR